MSMVRYLTLSKYYLGIDRNYDAENILIKPIYTDIHKETFITKKFNLTFTRLEVNLSIALYFTELC